MRFSEIVLADRSNSHIFRDIIIKYTGPWTESSDHGAFNGTLKFPSGAGKKNNLSFLFNVCVSIRHELCKSHLRDREPKLIYGV